jgi:2,3-bisphosphoglycerate-independent phosphoglycerate mutase
MKYIILQGDGMPDYPVEELGGKTPLEAAATPNMDYIARKGLLGMVRVIPEGFPPGSDVGNLSIMGYEPSRYYTGRAPLEAASMGVELGPEDVAYRCNLVTLQNSGGIMRMEDYSAGHISTEEAREIIAQINASLGSEQIRFYPGVSYRHLMVWGQGSERVKTTPPHDIMGKEITPYLPQGDGGEVLNGLIQRSQVILKDLSINRARIAAGKSPANSIWLWGQGRAPRLPTLRERYGIEGAVISAVDLVRGIGIYAGLKVVNVPGATGYLDTNYSGKAEYALRELKQGDFIYLHVEAPDEAGHSGEPGSKIKAIEDFDLRVVGKVLEGIRKFAEYKIMVISDHPTPLSLRTHSREPVPFAILSSSDEARGDKKDIAPGFDEGAAEGTGVFFDRGWELMEEFIVSRPASRT